MEDRIFVRENAQPAAAPKTNLIIVAVALVVIGIIAILLITRNSTPTSVPENSGEEIADSITNPVNPSETDTSELDDEEAEESLTPTETEEEEEEATPTEFGPPTDTTKLHVYYLKSGFSQLTPVLRDKPASAIEAFIINQTFIGPNDAEEAEGYSIDWSFGATSNCGSTKSYKFTLTGKNMRLDLCREFTGSDPENFKTALTQALTETGRVDKVAIMDPSGTCLGEASGDTSCL